MGQGFKEVASLRGDDKKFEENFAKIKWSSDKKEDSKTIEECADDLFEDETDDEE